MTKVQWLRNIPRAPVLTLEDVMSAIDVVLSEAEAVTDPEAWRRPGLLRAVEAVESLEDGAAHALERGYERFAAPAMTNLRAVLVTRGFHLFDELDAAEAGLGAEDPLVWTPKAVQAELDRVRGVLDTVDAEAKRAAAEGKISADELKLWHDGVYAPGHAFVTTASTFWGSNALAAREHEQSAGKWRAFFAARGASLLGPGDLVRKPAFNWEIPLIMGAAALLLFGWKWRG